MTRTRTSTPELSALLRARREELGLSIEAAARAAGVGNETWRRYEAGGAMRADKTGPVCRALGWRKLPLLGPVAQAHGLEAVPSAPVSPDSSAESDTYPQSLVDLQGKECAEAFVVGCDILGDRINMDIDALSSTRRGTHIGELQGSVMEVWLPPRWLMRYDYEFLFRLRATVQELALRTKHPGFDGIPYLTRCVADDLVLHLILQMGSAVESEAAESTDAAAEDWEYELNGEDEEVMVALYHPGIHPDPDSPWHFDHWFQCVYYGLDEPDPEVGATAGQVAVVDDEGGE